MNEIFASVALIVVLLILLGGGVWVGQLVVGPLAVRGSKNLICVPVNVTKHARATN